MASVILDQTSSSSKEENQEKTISLSGKEWNVPGGFNLYLDITSKCNGSCEFCIAPTIGRKDGRGFFKGLEYSLQLTESIGGTVQIVGGEPMISDRLPRVLQEIGKHNYRRVVLNTNGSSVSNDLASRMYQSGVTDINFSRHHYDDAKNQEIMKLKPFLPNSQFAQNIRKVMDSGIDVRMQCNLVQGHIDDVRKMIDYIYWASSLGCTNVSFSQIFPLSLFDYQVPLKPGFTEKVQIDLRQLVSDIDSCGSFLSAPQSDIRGEQMSIWGKSTWGSLGKRRFWYGPNKVYVSLKTLSGYDETGLPNETTYNKKDDWELQQNNLAFGVLHPDGLLTASWDRRERVLSKP